MNYNFKVCQNQSCRPERGKAVRDHKRKRICWCLLSPVHHSVLQPVPGSVVPASHDNRPSKLITPETEKEQTNHKGHFYRKSWLLPDQGSCSQRKVTCRALQKTSHYNILVKLKFIFFSFPLWEVRQLILVICEDPEQLMRNEAKRCTWTKYVWSPPWSWSRVFTSMVMV